MIITVCEKVSYGLPILKIDDCGTKVVVPRLPCWADTRTAFTEDGKDPLCLRAVSRIDHADATVIGLCLSINNDGMRVRELSDGKIAIQIGTTEIHILPVDSDAAFAARDNEETKP